jgi:U3 small nucleolar RNA-associated protein 20
MPARGWWCLHAKYVCCAPQVVHLTSLQSVSQTLHTCAGSLIASLTDCYLTSDTADLSYTLLRRVLTALIHHCNGSEQFYVVASLVVDRFCTLSQAEDVNYQQLQRAMQIMSVVCSVHQGSRLSCMSSLFTMRCAKQ